ncbi:MAG: hypothetical protein AABX07_00685, partial [Nanoarchaeota archaeon]
MGRERLEIAIAKLREDIKKCENYKKRILNYVENAKNRFLNREIKYYEYEELISQKFGGKTLQEWLDIYDFHISRLEKQIKKEERRFKTNKILVVFFSFAFIFMLFSAFYFKPAIIGFFIEDKAQTTKTDIQSNSEEMQGAPEKTSPSQEQEPQPSEETAGPEETQKIPEKEPIGEEKEISENKSKEKISEETTKNKSEQEQIEKIKPTQEEAPQEFPDEETNATQSPVLIKEILDIKIKKNNFIEIDLAQYFNNIEEYYLLQTENISTTISGQIIKIQPAENFIGIRKSKITSVNKFGAIESNSFNIIVSEETLELIPEMLKNKTLEIPAPEINATLEINITKEEIKVNATINATIKTIQYQAVLGKPVKWKKQITPENIGNLTLKLPNRAENISVKKSSQKQELDSEENKKEALQKISSSQKTEESLSSENEKILEQSQNFSSEALNKTAVLGTAGITGRAIYTIKGANEDKSFFNILKDFFRNFFSKMTGAITGRVIAQIEEKQKTEIEIEMEIDEIVEYDLEYETPAPQAYEEEISAGKKQITISGPDELHYENILAFTELQKETTPEKIHLYHLLNGSRTEANVSKYDINNNTLIDYIEWVVPSLSNQTYELIIEISKAEHLDENKSFISDIYNETYELDGIWSETISEGHYARVSFRQNLTSDRDITIYPRIVSGTPKIEIYEIDKNEKIAEFTNINNNEYNKVYLTNLRGEQGTFDLKIIGGSVEFDYVVDPVEDSGKKDIISKRTINSKHYANQDGSFTAEIYSAPIFYKNDSGQWDDINTSLEISTEPNYDYMNIKNNYKTYLSKDSLKGDYNVKYEKGDASIELKTISKIKILNDTKNVSELKANLPDKIKTKLPDVTANKIQFPNTYNFSNKIMNIEYEVLDNKLHEEFILNELQNYPEVEQEIKLNNAYAKQVGDEILIFN